MLKRLVLITCAFICAIAGAQEPECNPNAAVDNPAFWTCNKTATGYTDPLSQMRASNLMRAERFAISTKTYLKTHTATQAIKAARESVAAALKDPDSARFRNVRLVKFREGQVICGEVNAKNSYGGYAGFTSFLASNVAADLYTHDNAVLVRDAANAGIFAACGE